MMRFSAEASGPHSNAMYLRLCATRSRMVSYKYNFAGVLNLSIFGELALQVMAVRDSGSAR